MIDVSLIDPSELSDTYYRLADIVGMEDTIRLSGILSGKCITFKKTYDLESDYWPIVECVGAAKAQSIIKGFYGESVYFSSIKAALKNQVKDLIRRDFNGYNYDELSERYGYTERSVRNIVARK